MSFLKSDAGAVTVDWVVLTAALVGLGLATMAVVSQGVENTSGDIGTELTRDDIIKTAFGPVWGYSDRTGNYNSNIENAANTSDAVIMNGVIKGLQKFNDGLEGAELNQAAESLDIYVASYQIAVERGLEIPAGSPTPQDLEALYLEAGGV